MIKKTLIVGINFKFHIWSFSDITIHSLERLKIFHIYIDKQFF